MAQFLVSLLPLSSSQTEKSLIVATDMSADMSRASPGPSVGVSGTELFHVSGSPGVFRVRLRNALLHVVLRLMTNAPAAAAAANSLHTSTAITAQSVYISS